MFYTYILRSIEHKRYYFGSTGNIISRPKDHNAGKVRSTKA
ncbi:MAG: GIY-YIG nuclease family protein, partial [Melioribacteraceae bacterium]|nr:GIY-YIG nuclease family protein [Melioribacteraceae bacterium]MCF8395179.1 GIY-YIG nuclease family protein [Melioribacteraceae bacterium]MCF8420023.1 GIY-YIG nuclease family protein [Melioribacteraceae bacterium]